MIFSIRATIRALVAPEHHLSCPTALWRHGLRELKRRGEGYHESGAFLLGHRTRTRRTILRLVYYDDLDPHALDSGIVILDGGCYGKLWKLCRDTGLDVIGDVHTHLGQPHQSSTDQENPMIGNRGHIAIIVPGLAAQLVMPHDVGIYEYQGQHRWREYLRRSAARFFYVGVWG